MIFPILLSTWSMNPRLMDLFCWIYSQHIACKAVWLVLATTVMLQFKFSCFGIPSALLHLFLQRYTYVQYLWRIYTHDPLLAFLLYQVFFGTFHEVIKLFSDLQSKFVCIFFPLFSQCTVKCIANRLTFFWWDSSGVLKQIH